MLSTLFPQNSLFRYNGHSVNSSVSLIKLVDSLQVIKHLTALNNNVSIESVLERCIETVHVSICETQWVQFL